VTTIEIFSPLGRAAPATTVERVAIPELKGATIGVLENTKPNAREILAAVAGRIADEFDAAEVVVERKQSAAEGAPPELIQRLSGVSHLVLAGSGD
jgi:hypothetical protein